MGIYKKIRFFLGVLAAIGLILAAITTGGSATISTYLAFPFAMLVGFEEIIKKYGKK